MKSILSLAAIAACVASAPANAGELANGAPFEIISPSIVLVGKAPVEKAPETADNKFDGFASHFPITASLDDPAVAGLSLDEIVGDKTGIGEESVMAVAATKETPSGKSKPVAAAREAPTPSPHPEEVAVVPPVATDEETASVGPRIRTVPAKLFEDMEIRTGD